jgi:exosome complex exonuclease RRP6
MRQLLNRLPCTPAAHLLSSVAQYYSNFGEFSGQVGGLMSRVQALLTSLPGATAPAAGILDDAGDAHAWATGMIDDALERVDDAVAATKRDAELTQRAQTSSAVPPMIDIDLGANAVRGRPVDVASQRAGARQGEFVSFMQSTYAERPQEAFIGGVDNRNAPFVPDLSSLRGVVDVDAVQAAVAAAADADATMPHPLAAQLQTLQYPASQLEPPAVTTGPHRAFEDTPFEVIDTLQALQAAAARLAGAGELAVDLEAHNYRSFQGFCCLMQLSTRQEDMVIDVLALRQHIGPALAPIFADPAVVKVLHGSDGDIIWLQRDFGIYIVNMFDTGQAARVLGHCGHGLGHLLDRVCGFKADKRWQLADWRVRPLSPEALHYARADTHFLLHCYDALRAELLKLGPGAEAVPEELRVELPAGAPRGALGTVLERSRRLCLVQYERERLRPDSFMTLYEKTGRVYTDEQLAVFAGEPGRVVRTRHLEKGEGITAAE